METNTAVTYVLPQQPQVVTPVVPVQTQVITVTQSSYGVEKSVGLGVTEIILRVICLLICLALLISASVAISAIDDVDRILSDADLEYEHADDYRGAAVWLVLVAVVAIIYHGITIFVRILYFTPQIENYFSGYSIVNVILCALFGLGLLAGAISNAVYASDNEDLYDKIGCYYYDNYAVEICEDLERVYTSEAAAAFFAFLAMVMFIPLFVIILISGVRKMQEASNTGSSNTLPPPYVHLPNNPY